MVDSPRGLSATPSKAAKSGTRWQPEEMEQIQEAVRSGKTPVEIYEMFPDRSRYAVDHKIKQANQMLEEVLEEEQTAVESADTIKMATRPEQTATVAPAVNLEKGRPWTLEEDMRLNSAIRKGLGLADIRGILHQFPGRSESAVVHRWRRNSKLLIPIGGSSSGSTPVTPTRTSTRPSTPIQVPTPYPGVQTWKSAESARPVVEPLSPPPTLSATFTHTNYWNKLDLQKLESAIDQDLDWDSTFALFPDRTPDAVRSKVRRIQVQRDASRKRIEAADRKRRTQSNSTTVGSPVSQSQPKEGLQPQNNGFQITSPRHEPAEPAAVQPSLQPQVQQNTPVNNTPNYEITDLLDDQVQDEDFIMDDPPQTSMHAGIIDERYANAMRATPYTQDHRFMASDSDYDFPIPNYYTELRDGLPFDPAPQWDGLPSFLVSSEEMLGDPFADIPENLGPTPEVDSGTNPFEEFLEELAVPDPFVDPDVPPSYFMDL